jgi:alpha-beta hydrolase superfamily lysophospholipase
VTDDLRIPIAGGSLALVLHLPAGAARAACVVACHGLGASKDSDKYRLLGEAVPAAGLALARFDFRGCGESSGREEETTVGTRVEDVRAVLARLAGHPRLDGRIGLLGSSMGGFVALHVAAARGDGPPVVTWNAPANLADLAARAADTPGVGRALVEEQRARRYAVTPAGVRRHLVIQGEADEVVAPAHGRALHARAADPRDLVLLPGADHRLTDPGHRQEAVGRSIAWLRRHLAGAAA